MLLFKKKQIAKNNHIKRLWVYHLMAQRPLKGAFFTILYDLREHEDNFLNYFRMSIRSFDKLLHKLEQNLDRSYCIRVPISPAEQLCVTLK